MLTLTTTTPEKAILFAGEQKMTEQQFKYPIQPTLTFLGYLKMTQTYEPPLPIAPSLPSPNTFMQLWDD